MTVTTSPTGKDSLVTVRGAGVALKVSDPPVMATVEFKDEADMVVLPHEAPSWTEDSKGQVIWLDVAADGLSAMVIPQGVGKTTVTVTTLDRDGARVQVNDVVTVVRGEPTHGVVHWSTGMVPEVDRAPTPSSKVSEILAPLTPQDMHGTESPEVREVGSAASLPSSLVRRTAAGLNERLPHHRLRFVLVVVVLVMLTGVGYVFLSYEFRSLPGAESLHSAVSAFKGGGRDATATNLRYEPPAEGVYELKGQGTERISFPSNSMSDGAVMPASVTYLADGCWRWHLDYNTAHWEEYDFCPRADQLVQAGNSNYQSWDFGSFTVKNLARFTCPSDTVVLTGNPVPGQTVRWTCTGTNTSVKGKTTATVVTRIDGTVRLSIGKEPVKAVHEVQKTTLSGGQKGTVVENWWFSATSGLPLRVERQITILTSSPLGTITYHENGSWQMASLRPRR